MKRRARRYAEEHGISIASATRILRQQDAAQHDLADPPDTTSAVPATDLKPGRAADPAGQRPKSSMAYWITWLVQAAGTYDPHALIAWVHEQHGLELSAVQQAALAKLLADPHSRLEDGVVVGDAEAIAPFLPSIAGLLDEAAALHDLHKQLLELSGIRPGGVNTTSATVDLLQLKASAGGNMPIGVVDGLAGPDDPTASPVDADTSPPGTVMPGQAKGGRGKSDVAGLLALALQNQEFEPVLIDAVNLSTPGEDEVTRSRQRVAAFLISWLVKVSGSEDPLQITAWLREHGRRLTARQQWMVEMLLADLQLRSKHHESSREEDDPERYLDNVMGLIGEELAVAWPSGARYDRSYLYLDLEQPEPRRADLDASRWPDRPLIPFSLGAKGGRCAGLPACRVRCTCGAAGGPSMLSSTAAHLAWASPDVGDLLKRKGQGSGPKQTGHHRRRGQR